LLYIQDVKSKLKNHKIKEEQVMKKKKVTALLLSCIMVLGMFAACGSESTDKDSTSTDSTAAGSEEIPVDSDNSMEGNASVDAKEVDYSEHETFTYWLYSTTNDYYASYSDNPVVQYLNEKFNVTLAFEQPVSGTEQDSLSLMFGTGEYTDVINLQQYTGSIAQLYEDGILVDIAEYLDYMPNLKNLIETDEDFARSIYDDEGRILGLIDYGLSDTVTWGGLVYRRDILDTMTGGNIAFPSGNDTPTTIEDWDYMLPLYKEYFENSGMMEYAPLIIPANGIFYYGELQSGFDCYHYYYAEDDKVKYGITEDGFYNYLAKLNEWYEAGYIYKDFASRTSDPFYVPNTALTYGGAAGIWYGTQGQLADQMSMAGLEFDVQPLSTPLDTENGASGKDVVFRATSRYGFGGAGVTTVCENIPKLLSVLDYLYSVEGGRLRSYGLTAEQIPADYTIYDSMGLEDGSYWFEGDKFMWNPNTAPGGGTVEQKNFCGYRMSGLGMNDDLYLLKDYLAEADEVWTAYDSVSTKTLLPDALSYPANEESTMKNNDVSLTDYINATVPKFIMGTMELNESTWEEFKGQITAYGIEENLRIQQEAYDRYLSR